MSLTRIVGGVEKAARTARLDAILFARHPAAAALTVRRAARVRQ